MINPDTNEDEDDSVVVTDDPDKKQLKHGEVLTSGCQLGRVSGDNLIVAAKRCLTSSPP